MIERAITNTKKDTYGNILGLCNPGMFWSPVSKEAAINEIETGAVKYYVPWNDGKYTEIQVVQGTFGKYLRTDKDHTSKNNLDDLTNC